MGWPDGSSSSRCVGSITVHWGSCRLGWPVDIEPRLERRWWRVERRKLIAAAASGVASGVVGGIAAGGLVGAAPAGAATGTTDTSTQMAALLGGLRLISLSHVN